jgi:LmbE family N-acetylglucosaminyl deacetylase
MPNLHLILSPHFDDAALSLGGKIRQLVEAGEPVRAVTLFAGHPGPDLSSFAREVHRSWGDPPDPIGMRREEDAAALRVLGSEARWLEVRESLYRQGPDGAWLYASREGIFGEVDPAERERWPAELAAALAEQVPPKTEVTYYAPLGVGNHVDHQLAHAAGRRLRESGAEVLFYEEYPYAQHPGQVDRAREARGALAWTPRLFPLTEEQLAAKVESVRAYRSQLQNLFGTEAYMEDLVRFYATQVGGSRPAERVWVP